MSSSNKRNLSSVSTDQTDCGGEFVGKKRPRINLDFDAKFIASSQDDLDIEVRNYLRFKLMILFSFNQINSYCGYKIVA